MSTKFLLLGGGGVFWAFGGGSADFIFMGARIFLTFMAFTAQMPNAAGFEREGPEPKCSKSQIASDFKSRSQNRKNIPQIAP